MKDSMPHRSTTHEERFFHLREPIGPFHGATVFFRKETQVWRAAVAFCSPEDQFNRRIGRNKSRRRYFQGFSMPWGQATPPTYE
jgi:hypothetical protein